MFMDRIDAGRQLAASLRQYEGRSPFVLALPRGGVPVGYEVASALGAPLDVLVVRKLGAPTHPELGLGAIAEGGEIVLDPQLCGWLGLSGEQIERVALHEAGEVARRIHRYRDGRPLPPLEGRTVILVDDGIATGGTARAAVRALRRQHPERLVLAVPVASTHSLDDLAREVDEAVCVTKSSHLQAIGEWYQDFTQVSDEQVIDLLRRNARDREAVAGEGPGATTS
jgi:putative phosphoribosyl transferase